MNMATPWKSLIWYGKKIDFAFPDPSEYEAWKAYPLVEFEFNANFSLDNGASILRSAEESKSLIYRLTPEIASVDIILAESGPCLTIHAEVLANIKQDLRTEAVQHWAYELDGETTATVNLPGGASILEEAEVGFYLHDNQLDKPLWPTSALPSLYSNVLHGQ